jgi:hypothetical protein
MRWIRLIIVQQLWFKVAHRARVTTSLAGEMASTVIRLLSYGRQSHRRLACQRHVLSKLQRFFLTASAFPLLKLGRKELQNHAVVWAVSWASLPPFEGKCRTRNSSQTSRSEIRLAENPPEKIAWLTVCREMYEAFDTFEMDKINKIGKH